jgi:hypothetical protein
MKIEKCKLQIGSGGLEAALTAQHLQFEICIFQFSILNF